MKEEAAQCSDGNMRERSKPASSSSSSSSRRSGKARSLWQRWRRLRHSTPKGLALAACSLILVVNLCAKGETAPPNVKMCNLSGKSRSSQSATCKVSRRIRRHITFNLYCLTSLNGILSYENSVHRGTGRGGAGAEAVRQSLSRVRKLTERRSGAALFSNF